VLIKGAAALETMARIAVMVLDKTGTLTSGQPRIAEERVGSDAAEVLRLAASLDQASPHPIAKALVAEAAGRGLRLAVPEAVEETAGDGLSGRVEGRAVAVGGRRYVAGRLGMAEAGLPAAPGAVLVAVAVDGRYAGEFVLADAPRPGVERLLAGLRGLGVGRLVLATGDRAEVAEAVTAGLGFDAVRAGLTPDQKVLLVLAERKRGPVMMVGDGVNDAPALAAADVGVAMGTRGAAASAEAADVVLLVDRLDRLLPGLAIARHARGIALQSVVAGLGLSLAGMLAAAFGRITPVQGALLQEAIDVAVILNALRVLRPGARWRAVG
jgi:P-type E1-E2 ATPase